MEQDRTGIRGLGLGRWLVVAALLLIGLGLYFAYAPRSQPPAAAVDRDDR